MATTNVPKPTFGTNGFIAPSEASVLAGVQADINAAFGGGVNPSLSTPQGQLASSMTAVIGQTNDLFVAYTNQVDPAYATGRMQDAIARIYFLYRNPATATVVQLTCVGLAGVVIPVGALTQAADGNVYTCTEAGTIPISGSIVLSFACNVYGPITCPAGTLNKIYKAIPGWDSVVNLSDGTIGSNVESPAAFEARRKASVAANAAGSLPSVLGAVLSVSGVLDAYVTENVFNTPVTIGGALLAPHSLYVAVVGGPAADVARAIWTKKAPGCDYNGNTTVVVTDNRSGYSPPYPTYNVTYEIPPSLPILFAVRISSNALIPSNAAVLIQNAIIGAFAGTDGGTRARIGSVILASRYYAPVAALGTWAQIISIKIGSANVPSASFTGSIAGATLTVSAVSSGAVAIGQTVSDAAGLVLPGTVITAGSGTTWTVSVSQTVASTAMFGSLAASDQVTVNINQSPTISAANIAVTVV